MLHRLPRLLAALATTNSGPALVLGQSRIVLEDGEPSEPATFTALGYRQTEKPACKGGRANNSHFWRFRHKRMRAIARSFRKMPFLSGHDWGDVRARGGTIIDAWADPPADAADELAFFMKVKLAEKWAIDALANGNIDRFSIGAVGIGEITCTAHGTPVWTDCWCWPGYVTEDELLVEWEFEDARGVELSGVNVPAVEGTGVVEAEADHAGAFEITDQVEAALEQLGQLCGRAPNVDAIAALVAARAGGAPKGGFTPAPAPLTMTACPTPRAEGSQMDRALICSMLGLPSTATDDEITAKLKQQSTDAAQAPVLQRQLGDLTARAHAAHVESEITRLTASRQVSEQVIADLRAAGAKPEQRASFDSTLKIVELAAPPIPTAGAAPTGRGELQSDKKPADAPGGATATAEVDAYTQHQSNPELARMMKRTGLTAQNVREHGPASVNVVPELREQIAKTESRGV